ncbi:MAG: hypothetical protein Q8L26_03430 [Candidatus Omnitrophota bacterium]|nr:hypothetical protein [Candidatus Omnitrophota bacterium]
MIVQFNLLKEEIKVILSGALRIDDSNYLEAVATKGEMRQLIKRFEAFFGLPVWPSAIELPIHVRKIIDNYGGIMPQQTLYFLWEGNDAVFAMLWPWQDGNHTTVKIIKTP